MKKLLRISLIVLGSGALIAALLLAALFFVQPKRYQAFVEQTIIRGAKSAGIGLSIGGSEFTPRRFTAHNLKIGIPKAFMTFDVDTVTIHPSLSSFLLSAPEATLEAKLYEGAATAASRFLIDTGEGSGQFEISNIKISAHPQFAALGIESGWLTASGQELSYDGAGLKSGKLSVELKDVDKSQPTLAAVPVLGQRIKIQIPAVTELNASATATVRRPLIDLAEAKLDSSLGSVRARGKITLPVGADPGSCLIDATVELTDDGSASLGQYLPLLGVEGIDPTTKRFRVFIKGTSRAPIAHFSRF